MQGQREDPLNFTTTPLYSSTIASPVWRQGMKVSVVSIEQQTVAVYSVQVTWNLRNYKFATLSFINISNLKNVASKSINEFDTLDTLFMLSRFT